MLCPLKTTLVVRTNYGDESIALVQFLRENHKQRLPFKRIIVVYIDTAWSSHCWPQRVTLGEMHVRSCGFEFIKLNAKASFSDLVKERKRFPSAKFQWCAGFLKGLPLIEWLDENDPQGEWEIAIAKRQALYQHSLPFKIESCEYHGDRNVLHPLLSISNIERDALLQRAGFSPLGHRSLECEPCINSHASDLARMADEDKRKLKNIETHLETSMFPVVKQPADGRQNFTMGCGDFFGCGL